MCGVFESDQDVRRTAELAHHPALLSCSTHSNIILLPPFCLKHLEQSIRVLPAAQDYGTASGLVQKASEYGPLELEQIVPVGFRSRIT
jgi:hypothetical protein